MSKLIKHNITRVKLKNRRVIVIDSNKEDDVFIIQFKNLTNNENPSCLHTYDRGITHTELKLSHEAAYALLLCISERLKYHKKR